MSTIRRVISVLLLAISQTYGATWPLGAEQMWQQTDNSSISSQLKTTLSKLYPIEHWTVSITADSATPFAPRFCWKFFRADPDTLNRLGEAIRTYQGSVTWKLGPPEVNTPICIVATEGSRSQFVGYPPLKGSKLPGAPLELKQEFAPTHAFIQEALADVPRFCAHLERYLRLEHTPAKSFDSEMIAPPDPPSPDSPPLDFVEPGMQVAWIVQPGNSSASGEKRMLHFGVTEDEWGRIHHAILAGGSSVSGTTQIEERSFPLLSRIQTWESAHFKRSEVESLRQECVRVRAETSDSLAIRGLDKLILICDWANHARGEIVLRAP